MRPALFDLLIALAAAGAIAGALLGADGQLLHWFCKPLATALIALRLLRLAPASGLRRWLLAGLAFSWLGDVLLMLPADLFLGGLLAFLLAHLCYIRGFALGLAPRAALPGLLLFVAVATAMLAVLMPQLPDALRLPVLAYVAVLVLMAALASAHSLQRQLRPWPAAALGGALFVLSDSLLAFNRFAQPLPLAALWVLASYYAAQWCLVRSTDDEARSHG